MKIELTKPLQYKGEGITELDIDLENMTGNDLILAEENYRKASPNGQTFSTPHMLYIAAKSCHVPAETLRTLNVKDFMRVIMAVMSFFGDMNSEVSAPEITDD